MATANSTGTPAREGSFSDTLARVFYGVFERVIDTDGDFIDTVNTKLSECRRDDPVELFLATAVGYGVLAGLGLWILSTVILGALFQVLQPDIGVLIGVPIPDPQLLALVNALKVPALIIVTGLVFGTIGAAAGFGIPVGMLWSTSSGREREINMLLPDAVSYMYALSIGGLNQLEILKAIATAEDVYGEVSREFQIIMHQTTYFDVDYRSAIRNRSLETPSDSLSQFLTDMLSILSSGGDLTLFLDQKKEKHMRVAKQEQESTLETLELFGEMYMTLSLFPVLLIILLVSMSLMGGMQDIILYGAVYGLIPIITVAFTIMISTVQKDDPGDGYLRLSLDDPKNSGASITDRGTIDEYESSDANLLQRIHEREGTIIAVNYIKNPISLFLAHPVYTLAFTIPLALIVVVNLIVNGLVPVSWEGLKSQPVWGTFALVHIPIYTTTIPFALFYEIRERRRHGITDKLSDNLLKLSSANNTGQTLLESFKTVSETSTGRLSDEFEEIYGKVQYGTSLKKSLLEFNNKYHLPRMARTLKLVADAQEASSQITDVLSTAATASENQDDLERDRKTGARMQMVIIIMAFLTMLAVMALLKLQFLDVMGELANSASGGGGSAGQGGTASLGGVDTEKLALVFFHAVTLQGIAAGLISGYMRDGKIISGLKYMIVLLTIALVTWMFV